MNTHHFGLSSECWLALSFIPGIGASRLSRLWTYLSTLDSENQSSPSLFDDPLPCSEAIDYRTLRALGWSEHAAKMAVRYLSQHVLPYEAESQLELTQKWLEQYDQRIVFRSSAEYPRLLNEIAVPPTFLYVKGNVQAWQKPTIGMVGAREASGYGRQVAQAWAQQLSEQGFSVVSGGARGIDTFAHRGALAARAPTVAVMGTGLHHWYPRQNARMFESVLEHDGALVSEYSLTTGVRPNLFPPRNRIISGMSFGVLVVEASDKSGSLISARYALDENREVFALPGRIGEPQATGTNQLIRQGATLVTSVEDILSELPRGLRSPKESVAIKGAVERSEPDVSREALSLFTLLQQERIAMDFDALIRLTQWQAPDLSQALMELELAGVLNNAQGQYQIDLEAS